MAHPIPDFKSASLYVFGAEGTVHVIFASSQVEADRLARGIARRAMQKGHSVKWPDGTQEWINHTAAFVGGENVFHEDGNRIKVERLHVRVDPDGVRTEKALRSVWRDYDRYYGEE